MKQVGFVVALLAVFVLLSTQDAQDAEGASLCHVPLPKCSKPKVLVCLCDDKTCAWQCIADPIPHG
jgi:hypothetical protein